MFTQRDASKIHNFPILSLVVHSVPLFYDMLRQRKRFTARQSGWKSWRERELARQASEYDSGAGPSTVQQEEVEDKETTPQSTLQKRLELIRTTIDTSKYKTTSECNMIVSKHQVYEEFAAARPVCGGCLRRLFITTEGQKIRFTCNNCPKGKEKELEEEITFGPNEMLIFLCLEHGQGYTYYCDLMTYLLLKPVSIRSFYKLRKKIGNLILKKSAEKLQTIKKCVTEKYEKLGYAGPGEDRILNVDVTFDGSWLTRGHKSHIGVVADIECETGFLLDFEVLSNFCLACTQLDNKLRQGKLRNMKSLVMQACRQLLT